MCRFAAAGWSNWNINIFQDRLIFSDIWSIFPRKGCMTTCFSACLLVKAQPAPRSAHPLQPSPACHPSSPSAGPLPASHWASWTRKHTEMCNITHLNAPLTLVLPSTAYFMAHSRTTSSTTSLKVNYEWEEFISVNSQWREDPQPLLFIPQLHCECTVEETR